MKLYSKVSSERATKGQGGNQELNIELLAMHGDTPITVGNVTMKYDKEKEQALISFDGGDYDINFTVDGIHERK